MRVLAAVLFILLYFTAAGQDKALSYYISTNTKEVNPTSKDFKKLNFLDTLLADKRIVMLGESSHGTEEYSQTKLQLIEYLHQKLGFNVVLFESPMTPGSYFNLAKDSIPTAELIKNTIQSVWHTETVLKVFDYIRQNNLYFDGFDPQFMPSEYPPALFSYAFESYPSIKNDLIKLEHRVSETFKSGKQDKQFTDSVSTAYIVLGAQLDKLKLSPLQTWLKHTCEINGDYYAHINKGNERDSCMAKNVIWLAEHAYPNEKIIVWAHNAHIDKNAASDARFMGTILAKYFGSQMYAVGFYMINGSTALNNRIVIQVKTPASNSLESLLVTKGFKTSFISTANKSFNRDITTLHWGRDKQKLNLFKSYDAVILVNGVSPPVYLKE